MKHIARTTKNGQRVYCGPAAIAFATGLPIDHVIEVANRVCGRVVTAMWDHEIQAVLNALGFNYQRYFGGNVPVWRFHTPRILRTGKHFVYVDGLMVCDAIQVTLSGAHWARSQRVSTAWSVERKAA